MKIFKLDNNIEINLPLSISDMVGVSNIYNNDLNKSRLMYAIINMVFKIESKCKIMSWGFDGIGINGKYYNYNNYLLLSKYLFELKSKEDIKLANRYYKLLKLKKLV